jgi:hypothetical protein
MVHREIYTAIHDSFASLTYARDSQNLASAFFQVLHGLGVKTTVSLSCEAETVQSVRSARYENECYLFHGLVTHIH